MRLVNQELPGHFFDILEFVARQVLVEANPKGLNLDIADVDLDMLLVEG